MPISNLEVEVVVPDFLVGKFFELHAEPKYDKDGVQLNPDTYVGWVHFKETRIEFGEPGV